MKSRYRPHRAFTLVELLTVITIIAVLGSISSAAFSRMRVTAQKAACMSGLRQLGVATVLYQGDHDGKFMPYVTYSPEGKTWYFGFEEHGSSGEGDREIDATRGSLYPYINQVGGIEVCPAFNYRSSNTGLKFTTASYGYGYNWQLGGRIRGTPVQRAVNVKSPASTILFADCAQIKPFGEGAGSKIEEFYIVNETDKTVHFRHGGLANVLFVDGHIEAMRPHLGTLDQRALDIDEQIGRLTPEGSSEMLY